LTCEKRADLLITVDNGISAYDAVIKAKELGYSVLITDHHTPPVTRVAADVVINPRQLNCAFPGKNLAGVGVAFYLAIAVRSILQKNNYFDSDCKAPNLKQFLDLVAIGTVADMVELDRVNRILVKAGMETLSQQANIGVSTLCEQCNLDHENIRSEDISFQLAPKINAAGRLGCADKAVALLQCNSIQDASALSMDLFRNNEERKSITLDNFHNARSNVLASGQEFSNSTVVAGRYHIGVAGIVASNLVEEFKKPTIVLCEQEFGILKGSARSVQGVNIYEALEKCSDILLGFGGHAMAAGMSLKGEHLQKFRESFDMAVNLQNGGKLEPAEETADISISIQDLFLTSTLNQLQMLEPHGTGNPQPIFRDLSVNFTEASPIGKDKSHLRLTIKNGTSVVKGVAFGLGNMAGQCLDGQEKAILYSPSLNYFRGRRSWQVRVLEISQNSS
jgi:single-stranded-DNA-specific exonuclease